MALARTGKVRKSSKLTRSASASDKPKAATAAGSQKTAKTSKTTKNTKDTKNTKNTENSKNSKIKKNSKPTGSNTRSNPVAHISGQARDPAIRVILLPRDTNKHGTIFGGVILSYIDLAGAAAVSRVTAQRIVTVAIKEVVFHAPVLVGEAVSFYTQVTRIGKTSVTVHVDVESMRGDNRVAVTEADITFVCVDKDGRPVPVERIKHVKPI